jgi:hypothetical protein
MSPKNINTIGQHEKNTTENSIMYMQKIMGYTHVQSDLVMKLFRHKLVHSGIHDVVIQENIYRSLF